MRHELKELRHKNDILMKEKYQCEEKILELQNRLTWLETSFNHCKEHHPSNCPLLARLGEENFNRLSESVCSDCENN